MNRIDRIRANLARDRENGWIGGVCAGIARYFNIDAAFARLAMLVLCIFAWKIALAIYFAAWLLLPDRGDE